MPPDYYRCAYSMHAWTIGGTVRKLYVYSMNQGIEPIEILYQSLEISNCSFFRAIKIFRLQCRENVKAQTIIMLYHSMM